VKWTSCMRRKFLSIGFIYIVIEDARKPPKRNM
jgi:hypothetical protein